MSRPRKYKSANKGFTREQLETWINQIEDLSGKTIAIHINDAVGETVLTVDLDIPKPSAARVQMGHIGAGGADPVQGRAYVLNQKMEVTVLH